MAGRLRIRSPRPIGPRPPPRPVDPAGRVLLTRCSTHRSRVRSSRAGHPRQPRHRPLIRSVSSSTPSDPPRPSRDRDSSGPGDHRRGHPEPARGRQTHHDQAVRECPAHRAIITDTNDFGIGKRPTNLPALREIGDTANRRLLGVQRIGHDPITGARCPAHRHRTRHHRDRHPHPRPAPGVSSAAMPAHRAAAVSVQPNGVANKDLRPLIAPKCDLHCLRARSLITHFPRIPDRARQPHPHNRSRRMTPSTRPQHTKLDSKPGFAGSSRASAGSRSTRPRADTRRRDVGRTARSGSGSRRRGSRSPARWSDRPPTRRGLPAPSAGAAAEPR